MARAPVTPPKPKTSALKRPVAHQATAAQVAAQGVTTGPTVTVACKLPNGLNLGHIHGDDKPAVILRGSNHPLSVGGYGLTPNIGADAWEKWASDHKFLPALQNNLIFAHERASHARAMAAEMSDVQSGLEPINGDDPSSDPRIQDAIEPTEDQKRESAKVAAATDEEREELAHSGEDV